MNCGVWACAKSEENKKACGNLTNFPVGCSVQFVTLGFVTLRFYCIYIYVPYYNFSHKIRGRKEK